MRWIPISLAAGCMAVPTSATADTLQAMVQSRYIETLNFNSVFSDSPQLQVSGSHNFTSHTYVAGYVYTGFKKPFTDDSSEYGAELGGNWNLSSTITANLAAGRYANYAGKGFGQGDWYARAGISYKNASVSATVLNGYNKTMLFNASYVLPVGKRLTLTPKLAYYSAFHVVDPALDVSYRLTGHWYAGVRIVAPKDDPHLARKFFGSATLTYLFF